MSDWRLVRECEVHLTSRGGREGEPGGDRDPLGTTPGPGRGGVGGVSPGSPAQRDSAVLRATAAVPPPGLESLGNGTCLWCSAPRVPKDKGKQNESAGGRPGQRQGCSGSKLCRDPPGSRPGPAPCARVRPPSRSPREQPPQPASGRGPGAVAGSRARLSAPVLSPAQACSPRRSPGRSGWAARPPAPSRGSQAAPGARPPDPARRPSACLAPAVGDTWQKATMEGDGSDSLVSGGAGQPLTSGWRRPGSLGLCSLRGEPGGSHSCGGARAAVWWPRFLFAFPAPGRVLQPVRPLSTTRWVGVGVTWARKRAPPLGCGYRTLSASGSPGGAL